jgi:GT2 family glycosyltransferase
MLANDDIQFTPGDLRRMVKAVERHRAVACFYGNHGASWWVVTRRGIDAVGTFDENLFPAYLEDCDWSRRCDLAGARRVNVPNCHAVHGEPKQRGSCTVNCRPALRAENSRTHGNNFRYYRAKWGGLNGQEIYPHPFNDPGWPIWAWKFDPAFRAEQQWRLPGGAT